VDGALPVAVLEHDASLASLLRSGVLNTFLTWGVRAGDSRTTTPPGGRLFITDSRIQRLRSPPDGTADTPVARAVRTHVERRDIDPVVVGTHGETGFGRCVPGSVVGKLVCAPSAPVPTARGTAPS
jgi:hypothetical protein